MASSPVLPKILSNAAVLASGPSYHGVPPPKEDVAKLNANEMNYGAHPEVLKAAEAATKSYHVYPDPAQSVLRSKIAQTHPGFSKDNVVAGSGSDDCLDVILRVIAPKRAIIPTPTFGMYAALCRLHHVKTTEIPRTEGTFYIDVEAIRKQADETSIIFLANPNNPTGTMTSLSDVETLAQTGALVVLDEAYMEFVEASKTSMDSRTVKVSMRPRCLRRPRILRHGTPRRFQDIQGFRQVESTKTPEVVND